jgi:hypothetical protein
MDRFHHDIGGLEIFIPLAHQRRETVTWHFLGGNI